MNKYLSALALAATSVSAAAAQPIALLAPGARDQVPSALAPAPKSLATSGLDRAPVMVSHALDPSASLAAAPTPYVAHSREFWSDVGESELRRGVKLVTTAPGALIRLSPQGGAGAALDPAGVLVRVHGRTLDANGASTAVADTKALRSAGMAVPAGTLAFRLAAATGSGEVEIAAPHAQGRYLVHVFEPDSAIAMDFGADRDTVLGGGTIAFRAEAEGSAHLALASGLVTAPDGYSADLAFTANPDGSFSARFTPDAAHSRGPALWEAHVFTAVGGAQQVLRDATTAFAVTAPTARFGGSAELARDGAGLHVDLAVDASAASRYEASGVLYGTGADGALHPAALAQSATWLGGPGKLELAFGADTFAGGLHAPFELRDLRLVDQATMSVIERRERALVIGD